MKSHGLKCQLYLKKKKGTQNQKTEVTTVFKKMGVSRWNRNRKNWGYIKIKFSFLKGVILFFFLHPQMLCETTIKQAHRQDTVWEPRIYNLRKPKVLNMNLFSCFQYFLQTKSGSNGQYENKVKRNCCQIGLVYTVYFTIQLGLLLLQ